MAAGVILAGDEVRPVTPDEGIQLEKLKFKLVARQAVILLEHK